MITSASPARRAIFSSSSVRSWIGGTGLGGNSRGNPVMGHSPKAGQAPDQANEGGQAGAGSTGTSQGQDTPTGGQLAKEAPSATRHQPWPIPGPAAGTDTPRLTACKLVAARSVRVISARRSVGNSHLRWPGIGTVAVLFGCTHRQVPQQPGTLRYRLPHPRALELLR